MASKSIAHRLPKPFDFFAKKRVLAKKCNFCCQVWLGIGKLFDPKSLTSAHIDRKSSIIQLFASSNSRETSYLSNPRGLFAIFDFRAFQNEQDSERGTIPEARLYELQVSSLKDIKLNRHAGE
jgi:hypothetical protein